MSTPRHKDYKRVFVRLGYEPIVIVYHIIYSDGASNLFKWGQIKRKKIEILKN